ncbi:MAG TPA: ATP-binding protein [Acidocella sp.]|jgi:two-component system sensor histidine kinase RpfC|nr:ATP-binding protein [Acidocella sp.]
MYEQLRTLRATWRSRPIRDDLEMVINRFIAGLLVVLFNIWLRAHAQVPFYLLCVPLPYLVANGALLAHALAWPDRTDSRRIGAVLLDCAAISYEAHLGGGEAGWLVAGFLWVIFGNGFRFGVRLQAYAMLASLVGYGGVVATTPYWRSQPSLCFGMMLCLAVVPLYAMALVKRLSQARLEAEAASRAKSKFLTSVSHELRTPLNAIIGMGALLESGALDGEQTLMSRSIMTSARSLLSLIDGLLDFSRIEAGKMIITAADFDLLQILVNIKTIFYVQSRAKGLRFNLHLTPRTPLTLRGDAGKLHEILLNLVGNAIKFTETGGITLAVDAVEHNGVGTKLRLEVSDTGIGIAREAQPRIFESFTQADDTILNRFGGTGLGLSLAQKMVHGLGGEIGVTSELGQGTRFWLELPFLPPEAPAARPARFADMRAFVSGRPTAADAALLARMAAHGVGLEYIKVHAKTPGASDTIPPCQVAFMKEDAPWQAGEFAALKEEGALVVAEMRGRHEPGLPDEETQRNCFSTLYESVTDAELINILDAASSLIATTRATREPRNDPPQSTQRLNLLVADDNEINRNVMEMILKKAGHAVTLVGDGEAALEEMSQAEFDVVLLDVNMPVLDGIETAKIYRMVAEGNDLVPLIAVTADATGQTRERCLAAGMAECLVKPVDPARLVAVIDDVLRTGGKIVPPPKPATEARVTEIAAHPRFRGNAAPVVDAEVILQLRSLGGNAFVEDVIDIFRREARGKLAALRDALRGGDIQEFRAVSHGLRSVAANVGAVRLAQSCLPYQTCSADDLQNRAEMWIEQLVLELARVENALVKLATPDSVQGRG